MAHQGETIENPLSGERMTFLRTTADTNGQSLEFEFIAPPGWSVPEHLHPHQQERTQMISGVLSGRVAGEELRLVAGEARFSVEFSPALKMESGFETTWGLARDGKATKAGVPKNPLQLVVLASEHKDEVYLPRPPITVQKALFAILDVLAPVGQLLGYRASYPEYSAPEEPTESGYENSSAALRLRGAVVAASVLAIFVALLLVRRRSRLSRR